LRPHLREWPLLIQPEHEDRKKGLYKESWPRQSEKDHISHLVNQVRWDICHMHRWEYGLPNRGIGRDGRKKNASGLDKIKKK
jgi:hypothetical protein